MAFESSPEFRAIEINNILGIYTEDECYKLDIPGTYKYYLRDGAGGSLTISIEKDPVIINFFGVVFMSEPLLTENEDYYLVDGEGWSFVENVEWVRKAEKDIFERM